jgi:hypothetical protein
MDRDRPNGEPRAAEEFAEAVREEAARFFDAFVRVAEEQMRRNPEAFRPRRRWVPEKEAASLAVEAVREVRRDLWRGRESEAPEPSPEEIEEWELRREERRRDTGYEPR